MRPGVIGDEPGHTARGNGAEQRAREAGGFAGACRDREHQEQCTREDHQQEAQHDFMGIGQIDFFRHE